MHSSCGVIGTVKYFFFCIANPFAYDFHFLKLFQILILTANFSQPKKSHPFFEFLGLKFGRLVSMTENKCSQVLVRLFIRQPKQNFYNSGKHNIYSNFNKFWNFPGISFIVYDKEMKL
jgi:hypothetical protein